MVLTGGGGNVVAMVDELGVSCNVIFRLGCYNEWQIECLGNIRCVKKVEDIRHRHRCAPRKTLAVGRMHQSATISKAAVETLVGHRGSCWLGACAEFELDQSTF
jgi:hypothetical protein